MVEKLTKYNVEMCHCFLGKHMETVESSDGEFFKVEDVEPILNNLQQLKAKISEFRESLEWYRDNVDRGYANGFLNKLDEIQKLSAV